MKPMHFAMALLSAAMTEAVRSAQVLYVQVV